MPGVRLGWLATQHPEFLARVAQVHLFTNTYPTQMSEFLTQLALRHAGVILAQNTAIAKAHYVQLEAFLDEVPQLIHWHKPQAGLVCFPRWLGGSTQELSANFLRASGWLLAPSARMLTGDAHFRIGFGTRSFAQAFPDFRAFVLTQPTRQI